MGRILGALSGHLSSHHKSLLGLSVLLLLVASGSGLLTGIDGADDGQVPTPPSTVEHTESPSPTVTEMGITTTSSATTAEASTKQYQRVTPEAEVIERFDPDDSGYVAFRGPNGSVISSYRLEQLVLAKVNTYRQSRGLQVLAHDREIASVARAHSQDMAARGYFSHTNPEGEQPWDRYGPGACPSYAENLAVNWIGASVVQEGVDDVVAYYSESGVAEGVLDQWKASPPHHQLLSKEELEEGGVGVALIPADNGSRLKAYVTLNVC